jgi:hypothetical protein
MVLSSCGGSSSALSKPEYVKQADAICAEFSQKLSKGTSKATATIAVSPDAASLWKDALKQLTALKAPNADRTRLANLWDEADQAFSRWLTEVRATTAADPLKALNDEPAIYHRVSVDAAAYGLHGCGS